MILYLLYRMGVFFALILPVKLSYFMACLFADGFYYISARDRKAVMDNLNIIMSGSKDEKTLRKMARHVFRNFAKYLVDFFRFQKIDEDYVKRFVRLEGEKNLKAALAMGKGVIALSAHIGNWEMGGSALSMAGYPLSAVVLSWVFLHEIPEISTLLGGMFSVAAVYLIHFTVSPDDIPGSPV